MPAHIFFVEDAGELRYAVAKILTKAEFTIRTFRDYWGLSEHLNAGATADLLITDIVLPSGTPHGIALAAMVRIRLGNIPVLYLTGYPDYAKHVPDDAVVLIKPVPDDILVATVQAMIEGRPLSRATMKA